MKDVLRATTLALLGAVVLAQAASAQTSFELTVQLPGGVGDLRIRRCPRRQPFRTCRARSS